MSTWSKKAEDKKVKDVPPAKPVSFTKLVPELLTKKLKVGIHGQPKCGKTRFAMSTSKNHGPTYMIITEPGVKPLAKLFPDSEIHFTEVYEPDYTGTFEVDPIKTLANIDDAVRIIRKQCLQDPKSVGTVVVDSVTDVWKWVQEWMKCEILKIDKTARVKQQWDWGHANNKYQNIIMQLLSLPCHVVLTAQDREEYAGAGQPSGAFVARWQKQTAFWVDVVISMTKQRQQSGGIKYYGEIEDCRHMNKDMNPIAGESLENLDFDKLINLLA